jgi:hypothetical protein
VDARPRGIWYEQVNANERQQPRFYGNRPAGRAARTRVPAGVLRVET